MLPYEAGFNEGHRTFARALMQNCMLDRDKVGVFALPLRSAPRSVVWTVAAANFYTTLFFQIAVETTVAEHRTLSHGGSAMHMHNLLRVLQHMRTMMAASW